MASIRTPLVQLTSQIVGPTCPTTNRVTLLCSSPPETPHVRRYVCTIYVLLHTYLGNWKMNRCLTKQVPYLDLPEDSSSSSNSRSSSSSNSNSSSPIFIFARGHTEVDWRGRQPINTLTDRAKPNNGPQSEYTIS